jgi:hypothetical protein
LLAHPEGPILAERWSRLGLGVRCAYNPGQPAAIRKYVVLGTQLARWRLQPEAAVYEGMLALLLKTAGDPALPWPWRSQCLEHSAWPVARLMTLLARSDPAALADWLAWWEAAQEELSIGPTHGAGGRGETGQIGGACWKGVTIATGATGGDA